MKLVKTMEKIMNNKIKSPEFSLMITIIMTIILVISMYLELTSLITISIIILCANFCWAIYNIIRLS